jgi:anti-repressor protein
MDEERDMFEDEIERAVQRRVESELQKIADNPDAVIAAYAKKLQQREAEIESLIPKADFADAVMQSGDWAEMAQVSKLLARKGWGRNNTFSLLRERGILRYNNEPYQQYVERGYFKVVEQHFQNPQSGETMINKKTVVSQRGIDFIRRIIDAGNE